VLDHSSSGQLLYPKVCKNAEHENAKTATAPRTLECRECDIAESTRVQEFQEHECSENARAPRAQERQEHCFVSFIFWRIFFSPHQVVNYIPADWSYLSPCPTAHLIFFLLSYLHGVLVLDTPLVALQKEYNSVFTGPLKIHILYNSFISLVLHT
jgi:hypothetical protein